MMNLAEYRRSNTRLADFLPWAALVGEGVVLNKDGSFQRTARFRGPDLDSAVPAELVAVAGRLNSALRRLGSGWAVFVEAQRHSASRYPASTFPDVASALVDAERKAQFEEAGAHYESSYFLTFLYLPPAEDAARAERFLYEGRDRTENADAREVLRGFVDRTDRVLQLVEGFMPECAWLDDPETLTYLHSCLSTKRHRVRVPEIPMYLDALLADQPLTGGLEPIVGASHLRVLTVVGFPTATRNTRRTESFGISVSLVDARNHARQDGCHQVADQDPPAMVRKEKVDRRHPQRGDDERGIDAARHGRPQQSNGRRCRAPGAWLRSDRRSLCHGDCHRMG
jgi:type IV secretion system protein VirB4